MVVAIPKNVIRTANPPMLFVVMFVCECSLNAIPPNVRPEWRGIDSVKVITGDRDEKEGREYKNEHRNLESSVLGRLIHNAVKWPNDCAEAGQGERIQCGRWTESRPCLKHIC